MTKVELEALIALNLPDNTTEYITPARLREVLMEMVDTEFDNAASIPTTINVNGSATLALAAGAIIDFIVVIPDALTTIKVGITIGGTELLDEDTEGTATLIRMDYYAAASTTIHFTGDCTITIYKK